MDGIYWHVFDLSNPGAHFEVDLMDRKAEVKCIIEDVINNMSDDDGGEEDSEDEAEDNGKEEKVKSDPDGGEEKWCHGLDLHALVRSVLCQHFGLILEGLSCWFCTIGAPPQQIGDLGSTRLLTISHSRIHLVVLD